MVLKQDCYKAEIHLSETYIDHERKWEYLGHCERVQSVPGPETPMHTKDPSSKEVTDIVKKARSGTKPGPNGVPYKVYNKCAMVLKYLCHKTVKSTCSMEEGEMYHYMLAASRGMFYPKRGNVRACHQVEDDFPVYCGGEDIFLSIGKTHDIVYDREQLCR